MAVGVPPALFLLSDLLEQGWSHTWCLGCREVIQGALSAPRAVFPSHLPLLLPRQLRPVPSPGPLGPHLLWILEPKLTWLSLFHKEGR